MTSRTIQRPFKFKENRNLATSASSRRRQKTRSILQEEWERYRNQILSLHPSHKIRKLREKMAIEHGFLATEAQYKRQLKRWGVKKYEKISEKHMRIIIRKIKRRGARGQHHSAIRLNREKQASVPFQRKLNRVLGKNSKALTEDTASIVSVPVTECSSIGCRISVYTSSTGRGVRLKRSGIYNKGPQIGKPRSVVVSTRSGGRGTYAGSVAATRTMDDEHFQTDTQIAARMCDALWYMSGQHNGVFDDVSPLRIRDVKNYMKTLTLTSRSDFDVGSIIVCLFFLTSSSEGPFIAKHYCGQFWTHKTSSYSIHCEKCDFAMLFHSSEDVAEWDATQWYLSGKPPTRLITFVKQFQDQHSNMDCGWSEPSNGVSSGLSAHLKQFSNSPVGEFGGRDLEEMIPVPPYMVAQLALVQGETQKGPSLAEGDIQKVSLDEDTLHNYLLGFPTHEQLAMGGFAELGSFDTTYEQEKDIFAAVW